MRDECLKRGPDDPAPDLHGPDELPGGDGRIECAQIQAVLCEYFDRELGPHATTLVREHVRRCPACQAQVALYAETVAALKAADPARTVPAALTARRRRRVVWAWTHPFLAWCVLRHRWISWFAVVATLVAVAWAMRQWRMATPPPEGIRVDVGQPERSPSP